MTKQFIYTVFLILAAALLRGQTFTLNTQPDGTTGIDATVSRSTPTLNQGTSTTIRASRNTLSQYERGLIKFNFTMQPGVTILSAKLILYGTNHVGTSDNNGILQMVPDTWSESLATWNNTALLASTNMPTVGLPAPTSSTQNYTLDVTSMVQTMVNTPAVNFGWMLKMAAENASNNKSLEFASSDNSTSSKRPQLIVEYCNPMTVNAFISPSSRDTSHNAGVTLNVSNGVAPFTYSWSNGSTGSSLNNVTPGVYRVTITDSRGNAAVKEVPVLTNCGALTYTLDYSPHGAFSDAMLLNESFNSNTANSNFGTSPGITAYNRTSGSGNSIARSLLAFDLSMLPDNFLVDQASMLLTDNEPSHASSYTVQLGRVTQGWKQNTVTYNNQPAYVDSAGDIIEFSYDGTQSTYSLDVTSHLQKMVQRGTTQNGWLLRLKSEDVGSVGQSVTFYGDDDVSSHPKVILQGHLPTTTCNDDSLNWIREDTYDENGVVISSDKTYLDNLGRNAQNSVKNASGDVFTSQTIYDSYGRAAINTMAAFTGNQLSFQDGFMRNIAGQVYGYTDFDQAATLNNPSALQTGISKTLGYYYSDNNAYDAYQATADNPYTRTEYTGDPGASPRRVSKPGNAFKMGSGHESYSFSMMSGDELGNVYGSNVSYKAKESSSSALDCTPLSGNIVATKQIVISPDNVETISYSAGGKVLATCYAGLTPAESCTYSVKNFMAYNGTNSVDIHLTDKTSLFLPIPQQTITPPGFSTSVVSTPTSGMVYTIVDLYTDKVLVEGTDFTFAFNRNVIFDAGFLAQYAGRSLLLRIGFVYDPSYESFTLSQATYGTLSDVEADYNLNYGRFSKNYYDLGSALLKSVSPKGFACSTPTTITMATTYNYDHEGRMIAMQSPDQDTIEAIYDTEGKLRFTRNAVQKANLRFSYINYDKHGRPYETGENQSSINTGSVWWPDAQTLFAGQLMANDIADQSDGLLAADKTNTTMAGYVPPDAGNDIPNTYSSYNLYRGFRAGPVNYVKNNNATTWYNYDKVGRKTASITQITETDFIAKNPNIDDQVKTSETVYNFFNGLTTSATYQSNNPNEILNYQFSYDANYRPTTTSLGIGGGGPNTLTSNSYNKMGQLSRVVAGNNYQGTDYVYTLNGGLKAINHPGLDATLDPGHDTAGYVGYTSNVNQDLFGEILEFYNNDYERSNTNIGSSINIGNSKYNGLTYAVRFKTRNVVNGTNTGSDYIDYAGPAQTTLINGFNYQQQELRFEYTYDQFNQLATTAFGVYDNVNDNFNQRSEYAETGASGGDIAYDRNGNITRLVRQSYNSTALDNLTYTIGATSNRLDAVVDAASNSVAQAVNFRTPSLSSPSSFGYNSIGQLTVSAAEDIAAITYFPNGKVKTITYNSTGNTAEYEYGPGGEKLKTKYHLAATNKTKYTWYVGPYIYEYDEAAATPAFNIAEVQVPTGVLRVNNSNVAFGYLVYQVTDHLGTVRATYKATGAGSGITILSCNDYYAFGGQLPGRSFTSEDYRFAFQGQEKGNTGTPWYQFDLRQYNPDLGRWFAPDPYGQFASPYLAMANNPVSTVDPNGGWVNFATGKVGEFRNKQTMDMQRDMGIGAFSYTEIQKRYEEEFENITMHALDPGYGSRQNITAYLAAVNELNNLYMGLTFRSGIYVSFKNGTEYLTQGEIGSNNLAVHNNQSNIMGYMSSQMDTHYQVAANDPLAEWDKDKTEGRIKVGGVFKELISQAVMINNATGKVDVVKAYDDGSETHVIYDLNGENREDGSPKLEEVKILSAEEVNAQNEINAGTSYDSRTYLQQIVRPDADGYLTLEEANDWYRNGNGVTLNVDITKLDLSGIYVQDFPKGVGSTQVFNLLLRSNTSDDGLVYGNITLRLYPNNMVKAFQDQYNFEMHSWWNPFNWPRNMETLIGEAVAGEGTPFRININGAAYINLYHPGSVH